MSRPLTREEIEREIAPLFSRHDPRGIYLANHSLGRPLDATANDIAEFLDLWYAELDEAWSTWLPEIRAYGRRVGDLLGLPPGGAVTLKTSAGQGLKAVLGCFAPRKIRVICRTMEFDSIDFILRTYEARGLIDLVQIEPTAHEGSVPLFEAEPFLEAIRQEADLLVLSEVNFVTGQIFPNLAEVMAIARANGVRTLVDCYHGFGVFNRPWPGMDFAIGGSYKYVHGGPGACWLAVSPEVMADPNFRPIDTGWFAKRDLFGYDTSADRAEDERAWWESTPPVICVYQARAGLKYLAAVGVDRLRATSLEQQAELREIFTDRGLPMHQPVNPENFGAFSLLPSEDSDRVVAALADRGIRVDARQGFVRFGPHPLNTTAEFERTADAVAEILG